MPHPLPALVDCAVIGGGPAGCSAAAWLAQLGLKVIVLERAPALCPNLEPLRFPQDWLLGHPGETLAQQGRRYADHLARLADVHVETDARLDHLDRDEAGGWSLHLAATAASSATSATVVRARALLLATGLQPRRPPKLYPAAPTSARVLDSIALTERRADLPAGRTLLLGGGDNAVENALFLAQRGHSVTIWSRSDWRAQAHLVERLEAAAGIARRPADPLPTEVLADAAPGGQGVTVRSARHGDERFDHVAVLLGYEPEPSAWLQVADALQRAGVTAPSHPFRDEPRFASLGLFTAGDASGRQHPSVQTALGDGVVAAKQIEAYLRPLGEHQPPAALRRNNRQVIHITGLRFGANLGVLDFEREGPQPICVDAEVNLGAQTIVARDADIGHVLDYRRVRQIIIDECTAEHTDLLEALLGKLCTRLMKLSGVAGVRIKVTKLEIFPDCQVAISAECGQW